MGTLLDPGNFRLGQCIIGTIRIPDAALPGDDLKPDAGVEILSAADIAIMIEVTLIVIAVADSCAQGVANGGVLSGKLPGFTGVDPLQLITVADGDGVFLNHLCVGFLLLNGSHLISVAVVTDLIGPGLVPKMAGQGEILLDITP